MTGLLYDQFPPIEILFGDDVRLYNAVAAHFDSSIPLAMLSEASLRKFRGIGPFFANQIHARLIAVHIYPARYVETQHDTVNRLFDCIEDAPMHVLDLTGPFSPLFSNRYEPLEALRTLDQFVPEMSVLNLIEYSFDELAEYIIGGLQGESDADALHPQLSELSQRLRSWGLRFSEPTDLSLAVAAFKK